MARKASRKKKADSAAKIGFGADSGVERLDAFRPNLHPSDARAHSDMIQTS